MQGSKIRLSVAEAVLFTDPQIILTKNSILQKTAELLSDVQAAIQTDMTNELISNSPLPKISKGENYLGLPYLILDYPRISNGDALFFIRSMFWWGNFYSSTLQLGGRFREEYTENLTNAFEELSVANYFVGINPDPWVHHFEEDNYKAIGTLSKKAFSFIVHQHPHIKIAARWPLQEWDAAANNLLESWRFLIRLTNPVWE